MKSIYLYLFLSCLFIGSACTKEIQPVFKEQQQLKYTHNWEKLETYPLRAGRSDDLHFFNPQKGFVINSQGILVLTEDGGETWSSKFEKERTFFRCLTFKDESTGWLGTLGTGDASLRSRDTIALYETTDGGDTWAPTSFIGPNPKGLCGLQTVSDKVIVGCGRVRGPSFFIKTTDGGTTWHSYDLNHVAGSLIAPHFYNEQHGILIGGTTTDKVQCQSLILETVDGGATWDTLYISKQRGEYCWKISFPTKDRGFISIQRNVDDGRFYVLETKDGGKTWQENIYIDEPYYVQGIGFLNEQVGWMGGSTKWTMETRDGGATWQRMADIGRGFNKFQFFGDSLAYGVGFGVYKMQGLRPLPNGAVRSYYPNGQLESEIQYQQGSRKGKAQYYYETGGVESKGVLANNLKTKKWTFFDTNGNRLKKIKYQNGIAKIPSQTAQQFVGTYQVNENVNRIITYDAGQLYSKLSQANKTYKIFPISDTEFVYDFDKDTRVEFVKDASGKVTHHLMKVRSRETKAEKVE